MRGRISLADAHTNLAMTCWRISLAYGLTNSLAAQSLRDRPEAARLCCRGAACVPRGMRLHQGMSNNTLQRRPRRAILMRTFNAVRGPAKRER